jgi:hypothetical protein
MRRRRGEAAGIASLDLGGFLTKTTQARASPVSRGLASPPRSLALARLPQVASRTSCSATRGEDGPSLGLRWFQETAQVALGPPASNLWSNFGRATMAVSCAPLASGGFQRILVALTHDVTRIDEEALSNPGIATNQLRIGVATWGPRKTFCGPPPILTAHWMAGWSPLRGRQRDEIFQWVTGSMLATCRSKRRRNPSGVHSRPSAK